MGQTIKFYCRPQIKNTTEISFGFESVSCPFVVDIKTEFFFVTNLWLKILSEISSSGTINQQHRLKTRHKIFNSLINSSIGRLLSLRKPSGEKKAAN
jgi:hypothetical protein